MKNRFKKRICSAVLALCLCAGFSGCGKEANTSEAVSAASSMPQVTLPALTTDQAALQEQTQADISGYYETPLETEQGFILALELYSDGTGFYMLLDLDGNCWDDLPVSWDNGKLWYNFDGAEIFDYTYEDGVLSVDMHDGNGIVEFVPVSLPVEIGSYTHHYAEEYDGQTVEFDYWITLYRNHTGWLSMQDDIPIEWENGEIYYIDTSTGTRSDKVYDYKSDANGDLVLTISTEEAVYEETFYRTESGPDWDYGYAGGDEFSMEDLLHQWSLSFYVIQGEDGSEFYNAQSEDVFCYLDFDVNEAGEYTAEYHYESNGGVIDVPRLEVEYVPEMLGEDFYNQAWYARLSGTGYVKNRDKEPRPYEVLANGEKSDEPTWCEMRALVSSHNGLMVLMSSYVDGIAEPIVTEMYFVEAMG